MTDNQHSDTIDNKIRDILLGLVADSPQDTFEDIERGAQAIEQYVQAEVIKELGWVKDYAEQFLVDMIDKRIKELRSDNG